jgi:hypothetical protein
MKRTRISNLWHESIMGLGDIRGDDELRREGKEYTKKRNMDHTTIMDSRARRFASRYTPSAKRIPFPDVVLFLHLSLS